MGDNLDNRALPGVKINVIMGRHAGFLTAAAALARQFPDDGPHLIYMPERPFTMEQFVADVQGGLQEARPLRGRRVRRHRRRKRHRHRQQVHQGSGQPRQRAVVRQRRPGRCAGQGNQGQGADQPRARRHPSATCSAPSRAWPRPWTRRKRVRRARRRSNSPPAASSKRLHRHQTQAGQNLRDLDRAHRIAQRVPRKPATCPTNSSARPATM
jgi:hypothetical protein